MTNWLERARRELPKARASRTAETDDTGVLAVSAGCGSGETSVFEHSTEVSPERVPPGGVLAVSAATVSGVFEPPRQISSERGHPGGVLAVSAGPVAKQCSVPGARTEVPEPVPVGEGAAPDQRVRQGKDSEGVEDATEERAAVLEFDGALPRAKAEKVAAAAELYYRHLFGPGKERGCCFAPAGRFCVEGMRLREEYFAAASAADEEHAPTFPPKSQDDPR